MQMLLVTLGDGQHDFFPFQQVVLRISGITGAPETHMTELFKKRLQCALYWSAVQTNPADEEGNSLLAKSYNSA